MGAITLWGLGTAFFLFPLVNLPRLLQTSATALMGAELVALLVHSYGSESCDPAGCSTLTTTAGAMASEDVPALTAVLFVLAVGHGLRTRAHHT